VKRFVIFLLLAVQAGLSLSGGETTSSDKLIRFEETVDAMGTGITVVAYGEDRFRLQSAVNAALEEAKRLDELLSNYRPQSEWTLLNKTAGQQEFRASKELFDLLEACKRYTEASDGAFDISVGPLMKVWGFYKGSGRFPHRAEIRSALALVGFDKVHLNPATTSIRFPTQGMELDPGGIGKGYAVDRMAAILKNAGIRSALVTAGSSSIFAIGAPPTDSRGWQISIRHPKDPSKTLEVVYLKNESMSTSGNYEKFFRAEGKIWSHIMDPRTGYPAQGMYSVSVITPQCIDSEAWTKPYYINGRQWASGHKLKNSRVYLCEDKTSDNRSEPSCAWLQ